MPRGNALACFLLVATVALPFSSLPAAGHDGVSHAAACHPRGDGLEQDSDGDGLLDGTEWPSVSPTKTTDPCNPDTDEDGLPDGWEVERGFNPLDPRDAEVDADQDGLPLWAEYCHGLSGIGLASRADCLAWARTTWDHQTTYPCPSPANDKATCRNGWYRSGLNHTNPDTDNDALCDGGGAPACTGRRSGSPNVPGEALDTEGQPLAQPTDARDPDSDDDGLPDGWEAEYGLDPRDAADAGQDRDADGAAAWPWRNSHEYCYQYKRLGLGGASQRVDRCPQMEEERVRANGVYWGGTDPTEPNTDGDCVPDGWETQLDVSDATQFDVDLSDPGGGPDRDGLNNCQEFLYGTDPRDPDTDGDALCDGGLDEWCSGLDANGLPSARQAKGESQYATNRTAWDTDGEGLGDGHEVITVGTDPVLADTDGDGLDDFEEFRLTGTDPVDSDTDDDLVLDGNEVAAWRAKGVEGDLSAFASYDPDGDGLPVLRDSDSDNDGLEDAMELQEGSSHPAKADTDKDGLCDGGGGAACLVYYPNDEPHYSYGARGERDYQTNPLLGDTDDDRLVDGWDEVFVHRTDPRVADSDADTLEDGDELETYFSDPRSANSDAEGADDGSEARLWLSLHPWPASGMNARTFFLNSDFDGDGRLALRDWDSDGDLLTDWKEFSCMQARYTRDGQTWYSVEEVYGPGSQVYPWAWDSDGNGVPDGKDSNPCTGISDAGTIEGNRQQTEDRVENPPPTPPPSPSRAQECLSNPSRGWQMPDPGFGDEDWDGDGLSNDFEFYGWKITYRKFGEIWYREEVPVSSNYCRWDTDGDGGLSDLGEFRIGTNPKAQDTEQDGISDLEEYTSGECSALDWDSDNDGLYDSEEIGGVETLCDDPDSDDDGLNDYLESRIGWWVDSTPGCWASTCDGRFQSNPRLANSDPDGLMDWEEFILHTNPEAEDTDQDGLDDYQEARVHGTDPRNLDTDADDATDREEIERGTDPKGGCFADSDGDGLQDCEETKEYYTNPASRDTDGDLLSDYEEVKVFKTPPTQADIDRDSLSDLVDPRPVVEDIPPVLSSLGPLSGAGWESGFVVEAYDVAGVRLDASDVGFVSSEGEACNVDKDARVSVSNTASGPHRHRISVVYNAPIAHCDVDITLSDSNGNGLRLRLNLDTVKEPGSRVTPVLRSVVATALDVVSEPAGAMAFTACASTGVLTAVSYVCGVGVWGTIEYASNLVATCGNWKGSAQLVLADGLSLLAGHVAAASYDDAQYALNEGAIRSGGVVVQCKDGSTHVFPVSTRTDEALVRIRDAAGTNVVLHIPGFRDSPDGAHTRGGGLARAAANASGITQADIQRIIGSTYPQSEGGYDVYCGPAYYVYLQNYAIYVANHIVVTARQVPHC